MAGTYKVGNKTAANLKILFAALCAVNKKVIFVILKNIG